MWYIPIKCKYCLIRLPDADKNIETTTVQNNVNQAVVNVLKQLRCIDGGDKESPKQTKKNYC